MILNPFMFQATRLLSTSITGALLAVVVGHFSGLFLIFISIFLFLYSYILAFLGKYTFGKFIHKSTKSCFIFFKKKFLRQLKDNGCLLRELKG